MTALRPAALLVALLSLGPSDATAQDERLAARLDPTTRAEVEAVLDSARLRGLPVEPLVQKALEGASKGAPGPRIAAAVRSVLASLGGAREVLGPAASADELVAAAASLRAGASPGMLRELQRIRPRDGLAVPLAVLTDLVASGVALDAAWGSVEGLARSGARDAEFLRLQERLPPGRSRETPGTTPRPRGMPAPDAPRAR